MQTLRKTLLVAILAIVISACGPAPLQATLTAIPTPTPSATATLIPLVRPTVPPSQRPTATNEPTSIYIPRDQAILMWQVPFVTSMALDGACQSIQDALAKYPPPSLYDHENQQMPSEVAYAFAAALAGRDFVAGRAATMASIADYPHTELVEALEEEAQGLADAFTLLLAMTDHEAHFIPAVKQRCTVIEMEQSVVVGGYTRDGLSVDDLFPLYVDFLFANNLILPP